jgi:amino acid adenylation domain-containing protein
MLLYDYLKKSKDVNPNQIAVKLSESSIDYKQLDRESDTIADFMISRKIQNGETIGLLLKKSINSIIGIFGILKSGSVYVPLDIDSPHERINYIFNDCKIRCVMVDEPGLKKMIKNKIAYHNRLIVINFSKYAPEHGTIPSNWDIITVNDIKSEYKKNLGPIRVSEDSPAYILYTSGSTGYPKGVVLSHKNGMVFVDWAVNQLKLTKNDRFSSHAPFHFDLSILDIFATIKVGGTLFLIPPGLSYFPDAILNFIDRNKITVWYSVPYALIQLLPLKEQVTEKACSIKTLIYAGEVFHYQHLNKLLRLLPHTDIFNLYGPTETNVITWYKVNSSEKSDLRQNVPIGKACPYSEIQVVDENNMPVGIGKRGELIVRSESLMKGYCNNIKKTASVIRSINNENLNGEYYFTGDMVIEAEKDLYQYVSRKDNMVKTRGFRVELGEIEKILYRNNKIKQTAVIALPDQEVGNRIFAYYTANCDSLNAGEIDRYCSEYLPSYMIPEDYYLIDKMPLTSTGKINRNLLKQRLQESN